MNAPPARRVPDPECRLPRNPSCGFYDAQDADSLVPLDWEVTQWPNLSCQLGNGYPGRARAAKTSRAMARKVLALRGPNLWTYRPVLEVWLDLGALEDHPSNTIPGFTDRLTTLLPALIEHHCGVGERGGFIQRLTEGTWAGHVLEHVVIELLNLAGMPTGFGQTRRRAARTRSCSRAFARKRESISQLKPPSRPMPIL